MRIYRKPEIEPSKYATADIGKPEIIPFANMVLVCGEQIDRPSSISPSQWLGFWERVATL